MKHNDDGPNTCLTIGTVGLYLLYAFYIFIIIGLLVS